MTTEGVKRKLTAILSADVKGYSRLMGEDEVETVRTLTASREVMTSLIQQFRGRVVDSPGDNVLAEFASVVDAVQCAVEIQRVLKARNAELPENRRMEFRIGVNLGDVIEEGERIYGDGVNIAARVEGLAEGGGICISGTAHEHIENKLPLTYEYLGEHTVKNITKPIRVYRAQIEPEVSREKRPGLRRWQWAALGLLAVLVAGGGTLAIWNFYLRPAPPAVEPAAEERMAFPLPDKPSIAVLPFVNMSDDPKQEYFSDGMTEDLITDLSRISGLFVMARNSTFPYKGKLVKVRQVAEELGVRYVLEGSVRKVGDKVRINAQLIDATTGHHLWAERYDGKMDDVFVLQDKITQKIVSALAVKLTGSEQAQVARRDTDNIAAYDAFLKGWEHYRRFTEEDFDKAVHHLEKAIELDPNYGRAYAALALVYWKGAEKLWFKSLGPNRWYKAIALGHKYLEMAMKTPNSLAHRLASEMNLRYLRYEEAVSEAERAIALDPNDPEAHENMARVLIFDGRPEEGVDFIRKAMRLDPHSPGSYLAWLGVAHFAMGQLEEAVSLSERALRHRPEDFQASVFLAASYAHLGRDREAQTAINSLLTAMPWVRTYFKYVMRIHPFKDLEVFDRLAEGLRKAGFPSPTEYYRLSQKDRLTEEEIRALVSKLQYTKERFWIEDGLLCDRTQSVHGKYCATVFRNPQVKNDYIFVSDLGVRHWSPGVEVD